ncbi:hypothetical protein CAPTEDRAFT_226975 [Capitella teleta]|uniref:Uncharacterized protein n=1 Tax=Capitella teleta TaxID=283909 RepID=R7V6S4_CAPTE|nr:hypothetical protein CAPTEDRAFT_226975 [Capitella teleta]|eukprot:ELU14573.1 hypothetical protein CAPTEDRAFT_226975 [Capitella teleta]
MAFFPTLIIAVICCQSVLASSPFEVRVSNNASYSVNIQGKAWLKNSDTFVRHSSKVFSTKDQTLMMSGQPQTTTGKDSIGEFDAVQFSFKADQETFLAGVRTYQESSVAIFTQTFVDPIDGTSDGTDSVISGFPSFLFGDSDDDLGYVNLNGVFSGWSMLQAAKWSQGSKLDGGMMSGPLILFDHQDNVLIVSPFNNFMAASFCHSGQSISWGIMGGVDSVTQGFVHETIVFYGQHGINQAMRDWGKLMQKVYNRKTSLRYDDVSISYIGYYTDNGAYYYHFKEPGMNYEQTMLAIQEYYTKSEIPYKYLQYDDWFYPIAGKGYGATVTWDAMPGIFPHGLKHLYNLTQLPVVAHNRYWSAKTTYAKQNGGKFNFIMSGENSIPDDQAFWEYLFSSAKEWGLYVYEQDWLNLQSMSIKPISSDLFFGRKWLMQMGEAAANQGLPLQYCMALPRNALAALEIPAVTQMRVSIDYQLRDNQYDIGITALFADSIGIAPFKDNFWSMSDQPGNKYNKTEPRPAFQAALSLLSTGPVGVSDRVGYSDLKLINSLIMADGRLLKPSQAATYINAYIQERAFNDHRGPQGKIFTTFSEISGFVFGVVMATDFEVDFPLKLSQSGFDQGVPVMVSDSAYSVSVSQPRNFSDQSPLLLSGCSSSAMCLHFTSPIFSVGSKRVILLGEVAKMLPLSPVRISSIISTTLDLQMTLNGSPSEVVQIAACDAENIEMCWKYNCIIAADGHARLSFARSSCQ